MRDLLKNWLRELSGEDGEYPAEEVPVSRGRKQKKPAELCEKISSDQPSNEMILCSSGLFRKSSSNARRM